MSLARWGVDGSDIYLYDSFDGGYECCSCSLHHGVTCHLKDNKEAMRHVRRHVSRGDIVPLYTFAALKNGKFSQLREIIPESFDQDGNFIHPH